ncbi:MAG: hypothetical protein KKH68_07790 [Proteobacteria bacterium]|nr:hypothetical protein [Pseudomonadota bacterium]
MSEIVRKEVCKCENCGNEAEMVVTCSLETITEDAAKTPPNQPDDTKPKQRVKGSATCSHCGNEADMWLDL